MIYCSQCGASIPDNAKFCEFCGAPVQAKATQQSSTDFNQQNQRTFNNEENTFNQGPVNDGSYEYNQEQYNGFYSEPNNQPYVQTVVRPKSKVDFKEAIMMFFNRYTDFSGRSVRSEFWWIVLLNIIVDSALSIITKTTGLTFFGIITSLYSLVTLVPSIALGFRRLHDIGKSGLYLLIVFIPIAGPFIYIYYMLQDSSPDNEYGPSPYDNFEK